MGLRQPTVQLRRTIGIQNSGIHMEKGAIMGDCSKNCWWKARLGAHIFLCCVLIAVLAGMSGCSSQFWNAMAQGAAASSQAGSQGVQQTSISPSPVAPSGHNCPSCNMGMYFTGTTQVEWGKLMKLYRCPAGHEYWYNDSPELVKPVVQDPCPICGLGTYFTGSTRVEWGKLQKIYR